jgi:hypothetical protein
MKSAQVDELARKLVSWLETGVIPDGLFTADVFCDFTMPRRRLQAEGIDGTDKLRKAGHPGPGAVPGWRVDPTPREFEERWEQDGQDWYSREMARADVRDGSIAALSVYCTGDGEADRRAEHAARVALLRP